MSVVNQNETRADLGEVPKPESTFLNPRTHPEGPS